MKYTFFSVINIKYVIMSSGEQHVSQYVAFSGKSTLDVICLYLNVVFNKHVEM